MSDVCVGIHSGVVMYDMCDVLVKPLCVARMDESEEVV